MSSFQLRAGADIFRPDAIGNYPIHVAVASGSLNCLRILFEHETTMAPCFDGCFNITDFQDRHLIRLADNEGETILHMAVNSGNSTMIDVNYSFKHHFNSMKIRMTIFQMPNKYSL